MNAKDFSTLLEKAVPQLKEGAFLVSGAEGNPMTVGWALFGIVWGKPICTVFVRHSRYSHELMQSNPVFTVSFPSSGEMKAELGICGSTSGRDTDKLQKANLSIRNISNDGKLLSGCKIHFVCNTVAKTEMDMSSVSPEILDRYYNTNQAGMNGDPHTIYFAEILEAYEE